MRFFKPALQKITLKLTDRHFLRATVLVFACVVVFLILVKPAFAASDTIEWVASHLIVPVEFWILAALGQLTLVFFDILKTVVSYNDFINADAVAKGWFIVRDVANMFFILILLVIAFGTLFGIEKYNYNEWLRKVVIMAVLINFSKLITGFFIDIMQVITMTFVNAFADTAAGNLTTMVGLKKFLALDPSRTDQDITQLSIAVTLLIGIFMMATLCIVTLAYVVMFLVRIVALWVLTVLSPLAYLLAAFPDTAEYAQRWWKEFWKYASIGPVLAFFLWLALTITQGGNTSELITNSSTTALQNNVQFEGGNNVIAAGIAEVSTSDGILSFLVSIVLLVISLSIAAESGAVFGAGIADRTKKFLGRTAAGMGTSLFRTGLAQKLTRIALREVAAGIPTPFGRRVAIPIASHRALGAFVKMEEMKAKRKEQIRGQAKYTRKYMPLARRLANPILGRKSIGGKAFSAVLGKKRGEAVGKWVGKKAQIFRREATKWRQEGLTEDWAPWATNDPEVIRDWLHEHGDKRYPQLGDNPKNRRALHASLKKHGINLWEEAPRLGRRIVSNGDDIDQELWGTEGTKFDPRGQHYYKYEIRNRRVLNQKTGEFEEVIDPTTGQPEQEMFKTQIWKEGEFGTRTKEHPTFPLEFHKDSDKWAARRVYLMGTGAQQYTDTQNAMYDRHGGDMDKFFGNAEYATGRQQGRYLNREEYEASMQEELQRDRDIAADRLHIGDLQVNDSAVERGMRGESMTMYDDMMDDAYAAMDFDPNAAGVHLENDEEKQQFAAIAKEKYKQAQEQQRARDLVENMYLLTEAEQALGAAEVDSLDMETLTPEKRNELWHKLSAHDTQNGTAHTMEVYSNINSENAAAERVGALKSVKEDATYQQKLSADADRVYSSMANASSIDVVNQRRVGVSRYHTEQHEKAHPAIDNMDDASVNEFFGSLDPGRQQEMLQEFQRRWGKITSPGHLQAAKREILTDMVASNVTGRKTSSFALQRSEQGDLYDATDKVIREKHRGDSSRFYQSQEYQANRDKYLNVDAYQRNKKYRNTQQRIQNFAYGGNAKKFFSGAEFKGDKDGTLFMSEHDYQREEHEGKLAHTLGERVASNHEYRARSEVQTIPIEIRRKIWQDIPEAHRQLSTQYVHENINSKANDDEVMTMALSQMLSAHRGGRANGPLTLKTQGEQEVAILLHAAAAAKGAARPRAPEHVPGHVGTEAPGVISSEQSQQQLRRALEGISGMPGQGGELDTKGMEQALHRVGDSIKSLTSTEKNLASAISPLSRQVRVLRHSLESARGDEEKRAIFKEIQSMRDVYLQQPAYQQGSRHTSPEPSELHDYGLDV